jgi:hypothetical protein
MEEWYVECGEDAITGEPLFINDYYDGFPLLSSYDRIYFTEQEAKELAERHNGVARKVEE